VAASALDRRSLFLPLLGGLIALAWITLMIWAASPYGRYLDHGQWTEIGLAASLCRALPGGAWLVPAMLYSAGWLTMIAAMMLPTTLPLLDIFRRLTLERADRHWLMTLVIVGYVAVWGAFGLAAHGLDAVLNGLVAGSDWLALHGWMFGGGVLAMAGAFQFSALKYRCLERCRTPFGFVNQHWRGQNPRRRALLLGVHHGVFCVGCCWAIMLLMFVVGTGSVGWMFLLGAAMAVEKNMPWGRRLSAPLGVALLGWAGMIVIVNLQVV
jgi:predicted metal-binding membrane protein